MTLTAVRFRRAHRPFRAFVTPTFNNALVTSGFAILEQRTGLRVKMPGWAQAEMSRPEQKALAGRILATYVVRQATREPEMNELQEAKR